MLEDNNCNVAIVRGGHARRMRKIDSAIHVKAEMCLADGLHTDPSSPPRTPFLPNMSVSWSSHLLPKRGVDALVVNTSRRAIGPGRRNAKNFKLPRSNKKNGAYHSVPKCPKSIPHTDRSADGQCGTEEFSPEAKHREAEARGATSSMA